MAPMTTMLNPAIVPSSPLVVIGLHQPDEEYGQGHGGGVENADGDIQLHPAFFLHPSGDPDCGETKENGHEERRPAHEKAERDSCKRRMRRAGSHKRQPS